MGNLVTKLKNSLMPLDLTRLVQRPDIKEALNNVYLANANDLLNLLAANPPVQKDIFKTRAKRLVSVLKNRIGGDRLLMPYYLSNCSSEANLWNWSARFFRESDRFGFCHKFKAPTPTTHLNLVENSFAVRCMCGPNRLQLPVGQYHAFSCGASRVTINGLLAANEQVNRSPRGVCVWRHNRIRDALRDFIKTACPDAPVYKELNLPQGHTQLRADLVVEVGGSSAYVDVVVVNPASASYVESQRLVPRQQTKLEAALSTESKKHGKYRRAYRGIIGQENVVKNLIPFAMEATGTLGKQADELVRGLSKLRGAVPDPDPRLGWTRRLFHNRVSIFCARAQAEMMRLSWETQRSDAIPAEPLMVPLLGELPLEDLLTDNLGGPRVRVSQASIHSQVSE
jgi:hypothetical protein